jgi:serine/threonine protein kinase
LFVAEPELLAPGAIFAGRYEVMRCIKAGGMGAVYEVLQLGTRRRRALKTMLPSVAGDSDLRTRFELEATVAAEIDSEHIVEVLDAGVDEQTAMPFLVMELLKGEDLGAMLRRRGTLPPEDVIEVVHQARLALDKTHAVGIVHRDLKPENLFLTTRDDGTPRLRVLDFGIAKMVAQTTHANTTRSFGTPLFMSPEQIRGDGAIGPRADIYSLGHIAFALLVGEGFWDLESRQLSSSWALLQAIAKGASETASERAAKRGVILSSQLDAWFARATAVDASDRFETATELLEGLSAALALPLPSRGSSLSGSTGARAASSLVPLPRIGSRIFDGAVAGATPRTRAAPSLKAVLVGGAALVVGAGFIYLLSSRQHPLEPPMLPAPAAPREPVAPTPPEPSSPRGAPPQAPLPAASVTHVAGAPASAAANRLAGRHLQNDGRVRRASSAPSARDPTDTR